MEDGVREKDEENESMAGTVGSGPDVPEVGMVFKEEGEIRRFCEEYAYKKGFGIKKVSSKTHVDGKIKYFVLACRRGGKWVSSSKRPFVPRPSSRTDCKAKINVIVNAEGRCSISSICLEHNHDLNPRKVRFRCYRKKPDSYLMMRLEPGDASVVGSGANGSLSFVEKDCKNYIAMGRHTRFGVGDAEALCKYFVRMQRRDSKFFYVVDMDDDGQLRNVFWADARSRAAYEEFGDVVSFETTYLTNGYELPLAPFVGVNHHGQSVLCGCGFLFKEDTESFIWLFETWLQCMYGHHPKAIITDHNKSIQAAAAKVFPYSHHRLCLWHIMKKLSEKLSSLTDYEAIKNLIEDAVYESMDPVEFENSWLNTANTYDLKRNEWLNSLFEHRHQWVPVYVKKKFWAGMSTTQRSESMNAFFDGSVNSKTSLKQFVEQYDNVLKNRVEKESKADYDSLNSTCKLITDCYFERQFQESYTNSIFKIFQDELQQMIFCNLELVNVEGSTSTFNVTDIQKQKDGNTKRVCQRVFFNECGLDVRCSCYLFEFRGIICRHVVKVLIEKYVKEIPLRYILCRWRKHIKRRHSYVVNCYDDSVPNGSGRNEKFKLLCAKFFEAAEIASKSAQKHEFFMQYMDEGIGKVKDHMQWNRPMLTEEGGEILRQSNPTGP